MYSHIAHWLARSLAMPQERETTQGIKARYLPCNSCMKREKQKRKCERHITPCHISRHAFAIPQQGYPCGRIQRTRLPKDVSRTIVPILSNKSSCDAIFERSRGIEESKALEKRNQCVFFLGLALIVRSGALPFPPKVAPPPLSLSIRPFILSLTMQNSRTTLSCAAFASIHRCKTA